jgi:lipoyl(octanoyl) transferase
MARSRTITPIWLGRRRYEPVHAFMQALAAKRASGETCDTLLLVEHEPVITLGRGADRANILIGDAERERLGIDLVDTGRGGDVTFHGPGQLVAYPVLDLAPDRCDVRRYVADLTTILIRLVATWGIAGGTLQGKIGAWVDRASPLEWPGEARASDPAKIGAIGVRISRWVTTHGFALNASTDLASFRLIVPCGLAELGVTSIADLIGSAPGVRALAQSSLPVFASVLCAEVAPLYDAEEAELTEQLMP